MENEVIPIIVIGSLAGLLFTGAIILFSMAYRSRLIQQELRFKEKEFEHQQALLASVVRAESREREQLATAIHDGLMAQLASLKMTTQQLTQYLPAEQPGIEKLNNHIQETLSDTIEQARNLAHALNPPILQNFGLARALGQFARQFEYADPPLRFTDGGYLQRASPETEKLLYFTARELVQNAYKHAEATEVTLALRQTDAVVQLEVADNGKGLSGSMTGMEGYGFKQIESRVQILKGNLHLDSQPGAGARFVLNVPLTPSP